MFKKNFADELAVVRPATPRRPPKGSTKHERVQSAFDQPAPAPIDRPTFIPPINIETAPTPIPASVQHPGSMSRSSISSLSPHDDPTRASMDTGDLDSETPRSLRSQDRRSLTSRITGVSVGKSIRKTLSFRRKSGEMS